VQCVTVVAGRYLCLDWSKATDICGIKQTELLKFDWLKFGKCVSCQFVVHYYYVPIPGYVVAFYYLYTSSMFFSSKTQLHSNSLVNTGELRSIIRLFVLFITLPAI
jgi:hypothetical protein